MKFKPSAFGTDHLTLTRDELYQLHAGKSLQSGALVVTMGTGDWPTVDWCVDAWHRANPGAKDTTGRGVPSLYLLDFAREVLRGAERRAPQNHSHTPTLPPEDGK